MSRLLPSWRCRQRPPSRSGYVLRLRSLRGNQKQHGAADDHHDTRPRRDPDAILLLHLELDRTELPLVRLLRVVESPVHEAENARREEDDTDDLEDVHEPP